MLRSLVAALEKAREVFRLMDLKDLYRDVILDHNKRHAIRNAGAGGFACGWPKPAMRDRLTVFLKMSGDRVEDIRLEGKKKGCAISTASASMMTEAIKGKDKADKLGHCLARSIPLLTQQNAVATPRWVSWPRSRSSRVPGACNRKPCWHTLNARSSGARATETSGRPVLDE